MRRTSVTAELREFGTRRSVAMTGPLEQRLRAHLLRADGQEDLMLAVYQRSSGHQRQSALLSNIVLPLSGETAVHGNVSFSGDYVLRVAAIAAERGGGVAVLHSHPRGSGWQSMSGPDRDAEAGYANLVREITGLPLVGLTLAGADGAWSARCWDQGVGAQVSARHCESVRVVDDRLRISWNPSLRPAPPSTAEQIRTVSCWGPSMQADIARLRILIVGLGTLGLDVALRLAASGVQTLGILDFDTASLVNLDRLIGVTELDVRLVRSKLNIAERLLRENATAPDFTVDAIEGSICESELLARALDYDLIFCCVDDRPWPRSILNTIAYSDLIPVIDGGIHIDTFSGGDGLRNATWRSHVLRPGRPCMACNGQLDLGKVYADQAGLLDDPRYIAALPLAERPQRQNVALLAASAAASLLAQFVSYLAAPAGIGDPGPLRYSLSTHWLERVDATTREYCPIERRTLAGDRRQLVLREHAAARRVIQDRQRYTARPPIRLARHIDDVLTQFRQWLLKAIIVHPSQWT